MSDLPLNDNEVAAERSGVSEPDANGHAAMLLAESLIHGLIGKAIISVEEAVDIIDTASQVNEDLAIEISISPATALRARALLGAIETSLSADLAGGPPMSNVITFDPEPNA